MSDQIEVLMDAAARLDRTGIPYMISGSVALSYYGQPRMTRDIDIVVGMGAADVVPAFRAFSHDYYVDEESVRRAVAERGTFNLIHLEKLIKMDFIVRKDSEYRRIEFTRRREIEIEGARISIVSPEDLLLSKLEWSRGGESEIQMKDARNLIASVEKLDWGYIEEWSVRLGLQGLIAELRP